MGGRRGAAGPGDHGTTELLEVAYRFGSAVTRLASGPGPLPVRLVETWDDLSQVDGALSGLWPEPRVSAELADQVRDLLHDIAAVGPIESAVAAMDEPAITMACRRITALAFALHQAVGATDPSTA